MTEDEQTKYDEGRFERELDVALAQARGFLSIEPSLAFKQGESIELAFGKVMAVLVWRAVPKEQLADHVDTVLLGARQMLLQKNRAYGDSALNPVRVFATASPMEQLLVRLDDKVSRLERGQAAGEDVANDMLGYLLLVLMAKNRQAALEKT